MVNDLISARSPLNNLNAICITHAMAVIEDGSARFALVSGVIHILGLSHATRLDQLDSD